MLGIDFEGTFKSLCSSMAYFLVGVFGLLYVSLAYYSLFFLTLEHYMEYRSLPRTLLVLCAVLWLEFNVLFNYYMSVVTNPGTSLRNESPQLQEVGDKCRKCQLRKPRRAHHCSICQRCIFQMDHHCPWINNCVGHFNRRYFVCMLTYMALGLGFLGYLNAPYCQDQSHQSYAYPIQLLLVMLGAVLFLFCCYHWVIAGKGITTIELLDRDFSSSLSFSENLEVIFGTGSLLLALMPSVRDLKADGIRWAADLATDLALDTQVPSD